MDFASVVAVARTQLVEFGETQFIEDAELYDELHAEDVRTVAAIVRVNNPAYPLDDICAHLVDLDLLRSPISLALLSDVWLIRQLLVADANDRWRPVHMVEPRHQSVMPTRRPAAYREHGAIHLIDGLDDSQTLVVADVRRWGWDGAKALRMWYVSRPAAIAAADDALGSPADALQYLARYLAAKLAVRAKLEEIPLKIVQGRVETARKELLAHVAEYGKTDA